MLNSGLVGSQLWGLVGEPYEDMAHHRCPVHKPSLALTLDLRVFTGGPCLRCRTIWVGPKMVVRGWERRKVGGPAIVSFRGPF